MSQIRFKDSEKIIRGILEQSNNIFDYNEEVRRKFNELFVVKTFLGNTVCDQYQRKFFNSGVFRVQYNDVTVACVYFNTETDVFQLDIILDSFLDVRDEITSHFKEFEIKNIPVGYINNQDEIEMLGKMCLEFVNGTK